MSGQEQGWIQVDELWFYIQGLRNLRTELKGSILTFAGECDGQLSDPLLGRNNEIERYVSHSHQYPGVAVELGAQSLGWWTEGEATTQVRYVYLRGRLRWSLTLVIEGELKRHHHRRQFLVPAGTIMGTVEISRVVTRAAVGGVMFTPGNDLESDVRRLKEIHRQISDVIRSSS